MNEVIKTISLRQAYRCAESFKFVFRVYESIKKEAH